MFAKCSCFHILYYQCALTLPDSSSVYVDLHRISRVERLVIMQDEHIAPDGMDTG